MAETPVSIHFLAVWSSNPSKLYLSRAAPGGDKPILYYQHQPVDGGYTYTWHVDADFVFCNREYDMTLSHPR